MRQQSDLVYSFFNADRIIDFLLSIDMRPFVELSFMPAALASGSKTVFHYRGNVTPATQLSAVGGPDWNAGPPLDGNQYGVREVATLVLRGLEQTDIEGVLGGNPRRNISGSIATRLRGDQRRPTRISRSAVQPRPTTTGSSRLSGFASSTIYQPISSAHVATHRTRWG